MRIGQKKLLLLVSLALVAGAFALSACASGMSGSWVPSEGSVVWTDQPGQVGYDIGAKGTRSGGLVIAKDGEGYKVTLVSSDGSSYPVSTKMEGARIGVILGGEGAPYLFLHQTGTDSLSMDTQEEQGWVHVADFKQGTP